MTSYHPLCLLGVAVVTFELDDEVTHCSSIEGPVAPCGPGDATVMFVPDGSIVTLCLMTLTGSLAKLGSAETLLTVDETDLDDALGSSVSHCWCCRPYWSCNGLPADTCNADTLDADETVDDSGSWVVDSELGLTMAFVHEVHHSDY